MQYIKAVLHPELKKIKAKGINNMINLFFIMLKVFFLNLINHAPTQPACRSQKEDWESWNSVVGTRRARIYAIPPEALHTRTTRGQMESKYTNIGDLRDPVPLFAEGCTFWRSAIQEYGSRNDETGAVLFPSDSIQEEFYERYFPDDIPDEWSTADQCKSHGRGCIEKAIVPVTIKKEPVSRLAWKLAIQVR